MTNPDNVGGLPELPAPRGYLHIFNQGRSYGSVHQVNGYTADQMRAYGELCRAAPAGAGEVVTDEMVEDAAVAYAACLDAPDHGPYMPALREALRAALLRKLQQGAESK